MKRVRSADDATDRQVCFLYVSVCRTLHIFMKGEPWRSYCYLSHLYHLSRFLSSNFPHVNFLTHPRPLRVPSGILEIFDKKWSKKQKCVTIQQSCELAETDLHSIPFGLDLKDQDSPRYSGQYTRRGWPGFDSGWGAGVVRFIKTCIDVSMAKCKTECPSGAFLLFMMLGDMSGGECRLAWLLACMHGCECCVCGCWCVNTIVPGC